MKCKNCKKNSLKKVVEIGKQPLSGFFYSKKKTKFKKIFFRLIQVLKVQFSSTFQQCEY